MEASATSAQITSIAAQAQLVQVARRQEGNPLLRYMSNVRWEYCENLTPDYVCGSTLVVFVSLKFHLLKGTYAERRIKEIGKMGRLRILLVHADDPDPVGATKSLMELNKLCFANDFTCILAWSDLECARYLETLKLYEKRGTTSIQERTETEYMPRVTKVLTTVRSVNKSDVLTLLDVFGSLQGICNAETEQLALCPGMGDKKVKRLHAVLNEPFRRHYAVSTNQTGSTVGSSAAATTASSAGPAHHSLSNPVRPAPTLGSSADTVYGQMLSEGNQSSRAGGKGTDGRDGTISAVSLAAFQQMVGAPPVPQKVALSSLTASRPPLNI